MKGRNEGRLFTKQDNATRNDSKEQLGEHGRAPSQQPWTDRPYDERREREQREAEKATRRANAEKKAAQEVQTYNRDDETEEADRTKAKEETRTSERLPYVVETEQDVRAGNKATKRQIQSE